MDFALDTNFLIGLWRQPRDGPEVRWLLANANASLGLPWVVKAEFLAGAVFAGHSLERVSLFLADYPVLWPTEATVLIYARSYAALRTAKLAVAPNDLWMGATALAHDLPLLTRNVKELSRIGALQVVDYATSQPPLAACRT